MPVEENENFKDKVELMNNTDKESKEDMKRKKDNNNTIFYITLVFYCSLLAIPGTLGLIGNLIVAAIFFGVVSFIVKLWKKTGNIQDIANEEDGHYECSECHSQVSSKDSKCPECGTDL